LRLSYITIENGAKGDTEDLAYSLFVVVT
jgi:hypothetical protein